MLGRDFIQRLLSPTLAKLKMEDPWWIFSCIYMFSSCNFGFYRYTNYESLRGTSHTLSPHWESVQDDDAQKLSFTIPCANCLRENLAKRFRQLKPNNTKDVITFSWMKSTLGTICEVLDDIRKLTVDLELPIFDRKNNVKFLTGLDELKSEMDCFFKVVVSARMALLDNFQEQPPRSSVQQVRM
ncbi:hypothetical protein Tco_0186230 [Tanacetum coccineum]